MTGNIQSGTVADSPGVKTNVEPAFGGYVKSLPVGDVFDEVSLPDGRTIRAGDVVAFDEPDIDHRDIERGVHSRAFIGAVTGIVRRPNGDAELLTTCPIGRLSASDVEVRGEGATMDSQSGLRKHANRYENADAKALTLEWGTDIDGSGEDFRETRE